MTQPTIIPSDIMLVILYPQHYMRKTSGGQEIYVETPGRRDYDKHFWVEAEAVDRARESLKLLGAKGV